MGATRLDRPWRPVCSFCGSERIVGRFNAVPELPQAGEAYPIPVLQADGFRCCACSRPWEGHLLTHAEAQAVDDALLAELGA